MIKAIIIEDEPIAAQIIQTFIENTEGIAVLETFHAAEPAYDWLTKDQNKADVIFQDINLPSLNGVDLIKSLPNPPEVIFTTANPEYALDGFELNAVDYLVKPIAYERFEKAVKKLQNKLALTHSDTLSFKANSRTYILKKTDIHYFQSAGDYVKIKSEQHSLIVNTTMKALEGLMHPFLRVHKSYIVNTALVDYVEGNTLKVAGHMIPIGAKYRKSVIDYFT